MKINKTETGQAPGLFVDLVIAFDPLLQRYVRQLTKDAQVAPLLVAQVFQLYYAESRQQEIIDTRLSLKLHAERLCRRWLQCQDLLVPASN